MGIFSRIFGRGKGNSGPDYPVAKPHRPPPTPLHGDLATALKEGDTAKAQELARILGIQLPGDPGKPRPPAGPPQMGEPLPRHGWLGRRPDLTEHGPEGEPYRLGDTPLAFPDDADRVLSGTDVDDFLAGRLALMVDSSWLESLRFDPQTNTLIVTLIAGGAYFHEINKMLANGLAYAHSKGIWWWDNIGIRGRGNRGKYRVPTRYFP